MRDEPLQRLPEVARLDDVDVDIGRTPVLRAVSIVVREGEAVGLVGPNGVGKSTLLQVLATLLPPVSGSVQVLGADVSDQRRRAEVRTRIALLGHEPALHPSLTLGENLDLVAQLRGRTARDTENVLTLVGLSAAARRRTDRCSPGMVRRAEIARALLTRPDLLLLDEAHAGLDADASELIAALVADVTDRGGAAVVVSHDLDRLAPLVDRTMRLEAGRVQR